MSEARIECRCADFNLADLKIKVRRGDIIWVDWARADKSEDLKRAINSGAVTMRQVDRCRNTRPAVPEAKKVVVPVAPQPVLPPKPPEPEPPKEDVLDDLIPPEIKTAKRGGRQKKEHS